MREIEPNHVELALDLAVDGGPHLRLVERYPPDESASPVAELYEKLLGPGADVDIEESEGETVVTAEDDDATAVAATVAVGLVERAGGSDHLRAALSLAEDHEDRPGVY